MSRPDQRWEAQCSHRRRFKTKASAERYLARIKAIFAAAQQVCDGEIWTSIELIYITRIDCPTARLAAA